MNCVRVKHVASDAFGWLKLICITNEIGRSPAATCDLVDRGQSGGPDLQANLGERGPERIDYQPPGTHSPALSAPLRGS